jgi:hypothetical protein
MEIAPDIRQPFGEFGITGKTGSVHEDRFLDLSVDASGSQKRTLPFNVWVQL